MAVPAFRKLSDAERAVELKPSSYCNLEYLDGQIFNGQDLSAGAGAMNLSGWIGDEVSRGPAADPDLRLEAADNKALVWDAPVKLAVARKDVAADTKQPRMIDSGLSEQFSLDGLPAGRYHAFVSYPSQSVRYVCDNGRYIKIGG
jgi:hypothetical protein